ncbi:YfjI family protein [Streptomyces sp. NPDC101117]|uniref:YfjI family protein n=1 Tax=Streptomyces sp. NPDC101117 TaxID=3366108 RepID=UPI00382CE81F
MSNMTTASVLADNSVTRDWLKAQFGEAAGLIALSCVGDWSGTQVASADEALGVIARWNGQGVAGIYARATTVRERLAPGRRGGAADTHTVIDMWSDIDIAGPGHKDQRLPVDEDQALRVYTESGLPPHTQLIHSGGGLYVRTSFTVPLVVGEDVDLDEAARLAADWQRVLGLSAERLGVSYGTGVGDLSRVLRVPGTVNRKVPTNPRPCTVVETGGPRYSFTELRETVDRILPKAPSPRRPDKTDATRLPSRQTDRRHGSVSSVSGNRGPLGILGEHNAVPDVLEGAGWSYREQSPGQCRVCGTGGCQLWSYPGWDAQTSGTGANVHKGGAAITVWSETPGLPTGQVMSAGQLFAHLHHGGDESEAARDILRAAHGRNSTTAAAMLPEAVLAEVREATTERPRVTDKTDATRDGGRDADPEGGSVSSVSEVEPSWDAPVPIDRPPVPGFPLLPLGDSLARMVEAVSKATQVAPDLPAMMALPCITAAIGGRAYVRIRPGWSEPVTLWTVGVALPGERKTGVEERLTVPLREEEIRLRAETEPLIEQTKQRRRIAEERLKDAEKAAVKAKPENAQLAADDAALALRSLQDIGEPPALPSLFWGDITPAAMPVKASENAGRGAVLDSEGVFFANVTGRRFGNGSPDTTFALQAYDGKAVPVHRVQRGSTELTAAHLTLGLLVQPVILQGLARSEDDEVLHNGFVQRPLYSYPESNLGQRDPRAAVPVPETVEADYSMRIKALVSKLWEAEAPRVLTFTPEANEFMYRFEEHLEPRMGHLGDLRPIMSWASKLPAKLARIAAALTLYDNSDATEVTGPYMAAAVSMAPYFIAHARLCLDLMGANREAQLTPGRDVLAWLRARDKPAEPFSLRDAQRGVQKKWALEGGADAIRAAVDHLEDLGWVARQPADPAREGKPGRKPSPKYDVHPWIYDPPEAS